MIDKKSDPRQSGKYINLDFHPIEAVLKKQGYSTPVVENYSRLLINDLHLAELYRLTQPTTGVLELVKTKNFNPVKASLDSQGKLWVDLILELKDGITVDHIKKVANVQGHSSRYAICRIAANQLPEALAMAVRMESARPIGPLYVNIPQSIEADQGTLTNNLPHTAGQIIAIDGRNVIVGIVDLGCDFKHPNFRKADGSTRLLFLWDQNGKSGNPPPGFDKGTEIDANKINAALKTSDPYGNLHYTPEKDAHGTHVMDIAAGSSSQYPGVAPAADLIFVHLGKPTDPLLDELNTLGSSHDLVNAVRYIFDKADELNRPAVINISLGTNGGSHDGTSLVERTLDELLSEKPGRAIVIAAGNSFEDNIHSSGEVIVDENGNTSKTIEWLIKEHVKEGFTWDLRQELEIWYDKRADLVVKILDPDDNLVGECRLGESKSTSIPEVTPQPVIISHLPPDNIPGEEENHIDILIDNHYPKLKLGAWKIQLSHAHPQPGANVGFHAWIERNDEYPSEFTSEISRSDYTLNTIGNASLPIVVGSYDAQKEGFPISYFSSAGPSRNKNEDSKLKPELSAPGWKIFSARATYPGGYDADGTSMAAPHVAGLIALMFQAARDRKMPSEILDITKIRQLLKSSVDNNPPRTGQHDSRYGFGRVNGLSALSALLNSG